MKTRVFVFLFALLACALAFAADDSPEAVARKAMREVNEHGITAMVEYMHPDELARFKELLFPLVAGTDEGTAHAVESIFGEGKTPKRVRAMPPDEFMRAFFSGVEKKIAGLNIRFDAFDVLGAVPEGEIVHLVTRVTVGAGDLKATQMQVLSMKPYKSTWRMMLTGDVEGMAQTIRRSVQRG